MKVVTTADENGRVAFGRRYPWAFEVTLDAQQRWGVAFINPDSNCWEFQWVLSGSNFELSEPTTEGTAPSQDDSIAEGERRSFREMRLELEEAAMEREEYSEQRVVLGEEHTIDFVGMTTNAEHAALALSGLERAERSFETGDFERMAFELMSAGASWWKISRGPTKIARKAWKVAVEDAATEYRRSMEKWPTPSDLLNWMVSRGEAKRIQSENRSLMDEFEVLGEKLPDLRRIETVLGEIRSQN